LTPPKTKKGPLGPFFVSIPHNTQLISHLVDMPSMPPLHVLTSRLLIAATVLLLAGCEIPGLGPDPRMLQREADAKATGSACRYGLRSIEDCYVLNAKASKSSIFEGWKSMDEYMRENSIEGIPATMTPTTPAEEIIEEAPAEKGAGKSAAH
jgi:hypothetical protein